MKYLKKFSLIKESHSHEECVDLIIDTMRDFLDDERKIVFKSPIDDMTYQDYVNKNSNYLGFKPVVNTGNLLKSQFIIVFKDIKDYSDFLSVTSNMQSVIGKLKDEDWNMYDFRVETEARESGTNYLLGSESKVIFESLSYYFSKPDQRIPGNFKVPTIKDLNIIFKRYSLEAQDFELVENEHGDLESEMTVEFEALTFGGEFPQKVDDCFEQVCDRFGFNSYHWEVGHWDVTFFYN